MTLTKTYWRALREVKASTSLEMLKVADNYYNLLQVKLVKAYGENVVWAMNKYYLMAYEKRKRELIREIYRIED